MVDSEEEGDYDTDANSEERAQLHAHPPTRRGNLRTTVEDYLDCCFKDVELTFTPTSCRIPLADITNTV